MAKFRVRARTVDMLGRQQIAGIPSAIHELFKNAHDAYAERVDVDYFHHNDLFILRDDGMGMSQKDFEERWLTLGTESKLGQSGLKPPPRPQGKRQRPILGEKGVGRLAIAAIGPQVLVLTKPDSKGSKIIASFINWGFFELPGIDLDQIEIAVELIGPNELRSSEFVKRLVDLNSKQLRALAKKSDGELVRRIKRELEQFYVNPGELDGVLKGTSLLNDGHGTHFYIQPAESIIKENLTLVRDEQTASPLEKYLLGFANAWVPRRRQPLVALHFREHRKDATSIDLISPDQFFTPKEFDRADHHFEGVFDEYGNFRGKASIYGKKASVYKLKWEGSTGSRTLCGSFAISFAYLPGRLTDSFLTSQDWGEINKKLNRFGGLYIYRNGIRVLPYGDSDFDFLEIEKRRTLGAGYYFYSYRRIFGAVDIAQQNNHRLVDKAGREGLIQNKAYLQFREILVNFFLCTARDFFREKGEFSDEFFPVRKELREQEKLRRAREKYAKTIRGRLKNDLDAFFSALTRGEPEADALKVRAYISELIAGMVDTPKAELNKKALEVEELFDRCLRTALSKITIVIPDDVGLGDELNKEVGAYLREYTRLKKDTFEPLRLEFRESFENAVKKATKAVDRRVVGRQLLQAAVDQHQAELHKKKASALSRCKELTESLFSKIKKPASKFSEEAARIQKEYENQTRGKVTTARLYNARRHALSRLELVALEISDQLEGIISTLETSSALASEGGGISRELVAALEEKIEDLTNELQEGLELMQLGAALGIVQHEFISTIQNVRSGITKLEPWADANPELVDIYKGIHSNFEHLSGYLKLFDPFSRRLNPVKVVISGAEIYKYLGDLFGSRLDRDEIELKATSSFRSKKVEGYTSTFYPVFANLIDNAIYWLSNFRESGRVITLDANADGFLVKDNGPGIEPRYRNRIFDFGFTRKTVGRGMGLHISREALRREELHLVLVSSDEASGTTFLIKLNRLD